MSIFGDLEVKMDSWSPDYGDQLPAVTPENDAEVDVEIDIERTPEEWSSILPSSETDFEDIALVDGVRRLETRLHIRDDKEIVHGLLGSHCVGAVVLRKGDHAVFDSIRLARLAILGNGRVLPDPLQIKPSLAYQPVSAADDGPDAPLQFLQTSMRQARLNWDGSLLSAALWSSRMALFDSSQKAPVTW